MRPFVLIIVLLSAVVPAIAIAQSTEAASPAAGHYTTADTPLGDILDDPAARAVLDMYAPQVSHGAQIDMARGMTLQSLQQYAPDALSDQVLAKMDAEFAKLPVKK